MKFIDLKEEVNSAVQRFAANAAKVRKARSVSSKVDGVVRTSHDDDFCLGDIRLRKMKNQLNMFGVTRSQDQKRFHDAFILACLPKIYGDKEWSKYSQRILKENKIEDIHYEGEQNLYI